MGRVDEAMRRRASGAAATEAVLPEDAARAHAEQEIKFESESLGVGEFAAPAVPPSDEVAGTAEPHLNGQAAEPPTRVRRGFVLARKLVTDQEMVPASREQYRRLAATLHHAQAATGLRVVMIASAVPGEGKTLTAANLALTLSESYQRSVLIIDADLRRPSLHAVFGASSVPGLSEGLMSTDERKLPLHQVSARLSLLPAGAPSADPMAGLTSPRMRRLVDEARETFAWVIVDTPPIGLLPDASLLATMVDGTILVVKAGETPFELVKKAAAAIGPDSLLGVVLNRADPHSGRYGYGYGYYDYRTTSADGKKP